MLILAFFTEGAFAQVKPGIDVLATQHPSLVRDKNIGIFTSKSSIDLSYRHSIDRLSRAATIKTIITCDKYFREFIPGDGDSKYDALTNGLIYEYLDPSQKPSNLNLENIDLLVIDIQDIGIRYFKYITAMAQLLELACGANKPVILLDRPNPIGGNIISGFVLKTSLRSHFGVYPIPLVYGMTIGELALYFNKTFGIGSNLTIIGMEGYSRGLSFKETGLHWIPPFAHVNSETTPLYYSITGILGEMGVFSTGVGTTRPFRYVLAPWLDGELLAQSLEKLQLQGIKFIPTQETPYYGLFSQKLVKGVELVVMDFETIDPFKCTLGILKTLYELYPDQIPLNNETLASSMNILVGDEAMCEGILQKVSINSLFTSVEESQQEFLTKRKQFLIYAE